MVQTIDVIREKLALVLSSARHYACNKVGPENATELALQLIYKVVKQQAEELHRLHAAKGLRWGEER